MSEIITHFGVRFRKGICFLLLFYMGILTGAAPCLARAARPFSFIQISDPQLGFLDGNEDFGADSLLLERVVARIVAVKPDFVVVTGDMTNASRHNKQIACYQKIITKIPASIPVYQIPGNHDIGKGSTDDHIEQYIRTFGEDHFFFTYRGCSFAGINSCVIKDQNRPREQAQFDWLSKVLRKKARLKFVFAHHSFFLKKYDEKENYSNQSQEDRNRYWSLFKDRGVSCVIAGHLHDTKEASQDGIGMITCGPVGKPLGKGYSGVMVWTVDPKEGTFTHRYLSIDEFEQTDSPAVSFILMGDIHYCEERFYDLDSMLLLKPGDWRQITKTYVPLTTANWDDQLAVIKRRIERNPDGIKAVVQLGDLSEGLANVSGNADRMAQNVMEMLRRCEVGAPWLLVKGNHDITGVGEGNKQEAKSAFVRHYTPFIREQTGSPVQDGNYTWQVGDVLFVVLDAYNPHIDQTAFAKEALGSSTARYKFVCMHEPAIPASERCWHFLRSAPEERRDAFLKVLAENKAFFLCGHLHRYSVLRRKTEWGPIVQVMVNSVTDRHRSPHLPYQFSTVDYGEGLVGRFPEFSPETAEARRAKLRAEQVFVDYYQMTPLAGYAVLTIARGSGDVMLEYYSAFEEETPFDRINLSELYRSGTVSRK